MSLRNARIVWLILSISCFKALDDLPLLAHGKPEIFLRIPFRAQALFQGIVIAEVLLDLVGIKEEPQGFDTFPLLGQHRLLLLLDLVDARLDTFHFLEKTARSFLRDLQLVPGSDDLLPGFLDLDVQGLDVELLCS